jgi:hypothetical protein
VLLVHCRETVGVVRLRVVLAADPEEATIEQPYGASEDPPLIELRAVEIALDAPA